MLYSKTKTQINIRVMKNEERMAKEKKQGLGVNEETKDTQRKTLSN